MPTLAQLTHSLSSSAMRVSGGRTEIRFNKTRIKDICENSLIP